MVVRWLEQEDANIPLVHNLPLFSTAFLSIWVSSAQPGSPCYGVPLDGSHIIGGCLVEDAL